MVDNTIVIPGESEMAMYNHACKQVDPNFDLLLVTWNCTPHVTKTNYKGANYQLNNYAHKYTVVMCY